MEENEEGEDSIPLPMSPVLGTSRNRKVFCSKTKKRKYDFQESETAESNQLKSKPSENYHVNSSEVYDQSMKTIKVEINSARESETGIVLLDKDYRSLQSNIIPNTTPCGFQTASGKYIPSNANSHFATKLFNEILNPTSKFQRDNKFNFLSKKSVSAINNGNSLNDGFEGFQVDDRVYSRKRLKNHKVFLSELQRIFNVSIEKMTTEESIILSEFVTEKERISYVKCEDVIVKQNRRTASGCISPFQALNRDFKQCEDKCMQEKSNPDVLFSTNSSETDFLKTVAIDDDAFDFDLTQINNVINKNCAASAQISKCSKSPTFEFVIPQIDLFKKSKINNCEPEIGKPFKTDESGKDDYEALRRNDQLHTLQGHDCLPTFINTKTQNNPSFSTASGNKIIISEKSLMKIKSLFHELDGNKNQNISEKQSSTPDLSKETVTYKNYFKNMNSDAAVSNIMRENANMPTLLQASGKKNIFNDSPQFNDYINHNNSANQSNTHKCLIENSTKCVNSYISTSNIITQNSNIPTFSTASGNKVGISEISLMKINNMFNVLPELKAYKNQNHSENKANTVTLLGGNIKEKNSFDSAPDPAQQSNIPSFSTASGNRIEISQTSLLKINNMFNNLPELSNQKDDNYQLCQNNSGNQSSSTRLLNEDIPKGNPFHNIIFDVPVCRNTRTPNKGNNPTFSTVSGKKLDVPQSSLMKVNHLFKDMDQVQNIGENDARDIPKTNVLLKKEIDFHPSTLQQKENFSDKTTEKKKLNIQEENITPIRKVPLKRKLGSSSSGNGKMSDKALDRVKSIFGDMNFDDLKLPEKFKICSPSHTPTIISSSTPLNCGRVIKTPQFPSNFSTTPVRQTRRSIREINSSFLNESTQDYNCPFLIQKPTSGTLEAWVEELNSQKMALERKLELVSKRHDVLKTQMNINSENKNSKSPIMLMKKNRVNYKDVQNLEDQSDFPGTINNIVLQINPQNSTLIHFNGNWNDTATITIEEGCTLVPNQQGLIGLSEIEPAFCSMADIQKRLIPAGWIKNHYKWIIWKLASYERYFPSILGGCFTINNVIKQLKYRYLRELHNAERPALRRIYEMDDAPQKRMILCISNIFKNGDNVELELTDGWYSMRSLIDELLCHQVNVRKIKIGSKLIISGAELLNCDGCHPLEVEAQKVRLKINFNATRRAARFSKLGYQRQTLPFETKINTAHSAGGLIGAIKVYIIRAYPLVYMERSNQGNIWRNKNSEDKILQDFENHCFDEYENDSNKQIVIKRNVSTVYQFTVLDVLESNSKPYTCTIWDSTDYHLEQLKENQIATIYNVTLRSNHIISCNKKTRFELSSNNTLEFLKYKRKYVAFGSFDQMMKESVFGEFDSVGFVVKIHIEDNNQYLWLTNKEQSFLLVRINEGPKTCLLLSRIRENQPVALCNLVLKEGCNAYVLALGNQHTIVTCYPQYKFLREKLEELEKVTKDELINTMNEARTRIANIENGKISSASLSSSGNSLNFSRITSTDLVMSMINLDEVVNNTN